MSGSILAVINPSPGLVVGYPFEAGSLTDVTHAPELFGRYPMYRAAVDWLERFVAAPSPALNRPGHVCPRVLPALRQNLIWLVAIRTATGSADEAFDKGLHLPRLFRFLFADPRQAQVGSLLAFFPHLNPAHAPAFIDDGHRLLRKAFVRAGLMLGEFHPSSRVASARNPDFLVMRSPAAMFAVRVLTLHDLMFLDRPGTPRADRLEYLRLYLHHLGDQLSEAARRDVRNRIAAAEAAG